jgi:hypothetical protein
MPSITNVRVGAAARTLSRLPGLAVLAAFAGLLAVSVPPSGALAQDKPVCRVGNLVEVEWNGQWYEAEVLETARADGTCPITYIGYDSGWDEAVAPERIREAAGSGAAAADPPAAPEPPAAPDAPSASEDVAVPDKAGCVPGATVEVEWQGRWYEAEVLEGPRADGTCYITYVGYDSSWDEWVVPGRLRGGTDGLCTVGAAIEVEWQGQWYEAAVLEGPRADGSCYITYVGYDSSWDEWVTVARMRAP